MYKRCYFKNCNNFHKLLFNFTMYYPYIWNAGRNRIVDHLSDIYMLFTFKFYMVVVYSLFTDLSSMGFIPSVSPCRNLWKWWKHIYYAFNVWFTLSEDFCCWKTYRLNITKYVKYTNSSINISMVALFVLNSI